MDTSQVFSAVCKLIREQVGYSGVRVLLSPDTKLVADLQFDDLDGIEILMSIEDEFGIVMPDLDYVTVGDLAAEAARQVALEGSDE